LELAKTRTMSKVNTTLFSTAYNFSATDAALAVRLLKFLGAVDDSGNATSIMAKLQLQTEEKEKRLLKKLFVVPTIYYLRLLKNLKISHRLNL